MELNFRKSEEKTRFGQIFENDFLDEPKKIPSKKKMLSFREKARKRKMVINIEFTPSSLTAIFYPF